MPIGYTGDPSEINAAAKKFHGHADTFQNHIGVLDGIKNEYAPAVQGATGNAIQAAMQGALDKGRKLHATFVEIVDTLNSAGANFDAQDQENASQVNKYNLNF
ncbi:WXG100 family type VII secretion target [Nocardia abscessus]|uniref:WXG100 family type VII secretion target n=1 Tax=Nocardia abscessus TaxID=120957 RepID=UPI00245875E8|nr:WXG100 family type VII secretion target [Nocardia abscessus]